MKIEYTDNRVLKIASYYTPLADEIAKEPMRPSFYFNGVYLDGKIESIVNYDICYPANPEDFPGAVRTVKLKFGKLDEKDKCYYEEYAYLFLDGVFRCIVDDKYECTAFLWYDKEELEDVDKTNYLSSYNTRGLICLNTDDEALARAYEKYKERATCI